MPMPEGGWNAAAALESQEAERAEIAARLRARSFARSGESAIVAARIEAAYKARLNAPSTGGDRPSRYVAPYPWHGDAA
jgi:hypothetical protein